MTALAPRGAPLAAPGAPARRAFSRAAAPRRSPRAAAPPPPAAFFSGLFGKKEPAADGEEPWSEAGWKAQIREENRLAQEEVLRRRRGGTWQKEVAERRAKSSRYLRDPAYKKECDERNRAKFKAEQAAKPPVPKFGIIIPIIPVGIPEYDGGERFDLRLPYVDSGWVDEDDDYDIGQKFLRVLGLGRKKEGGEGEGEGKGGKGGGQKR